MVATSRRGKPAPVGDEASAKSFQLMEAKHGDDAGMSLRGPALALGTASDNDSAWLLQAIRLRDRAFQLAQSRVDCDLQAAGAHEGCIDQGNATSHIQEVAALTADYLFESEKMIDLMRDMAQKGLLASPAK